MKNWKKFVGYQPALRKDENGNVVDIEEDSCMVYYLKMVRNDPEQVTLTVQRLAVNRDQCKLKKHELRNAVLKQLKKFKRMPNYKDGIEFERKRTIESLNVAKTTGRGTANVSYGDVHFYKGNSAFDCPIIVVKFGDRYGVFPIPNFMDYGFKLRKIK